MSKKNFEGEGNPSSPAVAKTMPPISVATISETGPNTVVGLGLVAPSQGTTIITDAEKAVLKKVLDRDRTAAIVHGGLKSLLTLTDAETAALLNFLRRV